MFATFTEDPAGLSRRFARQLSVPGFGRDAQKRLRAATVLVAGIGGIGGAAATYLAAAGVGRLVIVHPGVLEEPDLNRQTLMHPGGLGAPRVDCAAETLGRHYPDVRVETHDFGIGHPSFGALVDEADLVIDARHNFAERFAINSDCVRSSTPLVFSAMNGAEGQLLTVLPGVGPCVRCVFTEADPSWEPLNFPVLGSVAGMVGTLAATEAIKVVSGWGTPLAGLLSFDLADAHFGRLATHRRADCPDCGTTVKSEAS